MALSSAQYNLIERIDHKAKRLLEQKCSQPGLMIILWDYVPKIKALLKQVTTSELHPLQATHPGFNALVNFLKQVE